MNWLVMRNALAEGKDVVCRPRGNSMQPLIESGDEIRIRPMDRPVQQGDIVFCKVRGQFYIHLVSAVRGDRVQISNNKGHINGWTSLQNIFGRVIH